MTSRRAALGSTAAYFGHPRRLTGNEVALWLFVTEAGIWLPEGTNHTSTRRRSVSGPLGITELRQKPASNPTPFWSTPGELICTCPSGIDRQTPVPAEITAAAFMARDWDRLAPFHRRPDGLPGLPCPTSLSRSKSAVVPAGFACRNCSRVSCSARKHIRKPYGHCRRALDDVDCRGGRAGAPVIRSVRRDGHGFPLLGIVRGVPLHAGGIELVSLHRAFRGLVRRRLDRASALVLEAGCNRGFVTGLDLRWICLSRSRRRFVLTNRYGCFGGLWIERIAAGGQFHRVGPRRLCRRY